MAFPPSAGAIANRRLLTFVVFAAGLLAFLVLASRAEVTTPIRQPLSPAAKAAAKTAAYRTKQQGVAAAAAAKAAAAAEAATSYAKTPIHHVEVDADTLAGGAIMPKLGNETLKAELGRAAWKLFHTTMARFPDKPDRDAQTALFSYVHLFARLYPCGECAGHFRQILQKFPPQVTSRSRAAVWACFVHNEVNASLGKPEFDCNNIGDFYDCGCAEDGDEKEEGKGKGKSKGAAEEGGAVGAAAMTTGGENKSPSVGELKLEREGKTLGG